MCGLILIVRRSGFCLMISGGPGNWAVCGSGGQGQDLYAGTG